MELLRPHLHGRHDVLVLGFRRQQEPFPEDLEPAVAPDEAVEMSCAQSWIWGEGGWGGAS